MKIIKNWYVWWILSSIILTWVLEFIINFSIKTGLVLENSTYGISGIIIYVPALAISLIMIAIIIKLILEPIFDKIVSPLA